MNRLQFNPIESRNIVVTAINTALELRDPHDDNFWIKLQAIIKKQFTTYSSSSTNNEEMIYESLIKYFAIRKTPLATISTAAPKEYFSEFSRACKMGIEQYTKAFLVNAHILQIALKQLEIATSPPIEAKEITQHLRCVESIIFYIETHRLFEAYKEAEENTLTFSLLLENNHKKYSEEVPYHQYVKSLEKLQKKIQHISPSITIEEIGPKGNKRPTPCPKIHAVPLWKFTEIKTPTGNKREVTIPLAHDIYKEELQIFRDASSKPLVEYLQNLLWALHASNEIVNDHRTLIALSKDPQLFIKYPEIYYLLPEYGTTLGTYIDHAFKEHNYIYSWVPNTEHKTLTTTHEDGRIVVSAPFKIVKTHMETQRTKPKKTPSRSISFEPQPSTNKNPPPKRSVSSLVHTMTSFFRSDETIPTTLDNSSSSSTSSSDETTEEMEEPHYYRGKSRSHCSTKCPHIAHSKKPISWDSSRERAAFWLEIEIWKGEKKMCIRELQFHPIIAREQDKREILNIFDKLFQ